MPKSKPPILPEQTLEQLLDTVSNAREELVSIERTLERLRSDIANSQKPIGGSREALASSPFRSEFLKLSSSV